MFFFVFFGVIDESCCFPSVLVRSRMSNILRTKNLTYIPKFAIFKGMLPFPDHHFGYPAIRFRGCKFNIQTISLSVSIDA